MQGLRIYEMQLIRNNRGHKVVQQEFNRGMSNHAPVSLFPLYQEGIKGCVSFFDKERQGRFFRYHSGLSGIYECRGEALPRPFIRKGGLLWRQTNHMETIIDRVR